MTVSTSDNVMVHSGDGVSTSFTFQHPFYAATDLNVVCVSDDGTSQDVTGSCTVNGMGNPKGGVVTFIEPPATGQKIVITRQIPYTQGLDLTELGRLPANSLEKQLDRIVMMVQQINAVADRCLKIPPTDAKAVNVEAPEARVRAGKALCFDENGNAIVSRLSIQELENTESVSLESSRLAQESAALVRTMLQEVRDGLTKAEAHVTQTHDLRNTFADLKAKLDESLEAARLDQSAAWDEVTGKPDTFPPAEHTHPTQFVPPGALMYFAMLDAPEGWLPCKGQTVLREKYPALFAAIGTTYSAGDGQTTFGLPDPQGYFIRSLFAGRRVGTTQVVSVVPPRLHVERNAAGRKVTSSTYRDTPQDPNFRRPVVSNVRLSAHSAESMPRNISFPLCIKT